MPAHLTKQDQVAVVGAAELRDCGDGSSLAGFIADHAAPSAEVWMVHPDGGCLRVP